MRQPRWRGARHAARSAPSPGSQQPLSSLSPCPRPWGARCATSPGPCQHRSLAQACDCHRAKGHSSRATTRTRLGWHSPGRAPGRAVQPGRNMVRFGSHSPAQHHHSCPLMATTAPASVSPPGQEKLLPGFVGAALRKPFCLCSRQPPCPEMGPRGARPSAEVPPLPSLLMALDSRLQRGRIRHSKSQGAAPALPAHPVRAPWGQLTTSQRTGPRQSSHQAPGSRRQSIPSRSHPSPLHRGTLGPQRRSDAGGRERTWLQAVMELQGLDLP